jgi:anaerobic selenocysteine-containing dehydrogenase
MVHASTGMLAPASEELRSEPWIVAGLAKATVADRADIDWDGLAGDYDRIRDLIEQVYPDQFADYNARICKPGGFRMPNGASERKWNTESGKANFLFKPGLMDGDSETPDSGHLQLMTLRSHDQFNTTVYSNNDRYRGIKGERMVVFMNEKDVAKLGLKEGELIQFQTAAEDGIERKASGFKVVTYDIPEGCCGAYYPETNGLMPLAYRDERSNTPAAKCVPVKVVSMFGEAPVEQARDKAAEQPFRAVVPEPAE